MLDPDPQSRTRSSWGFPPHSYVTNPNAGRVLKHLEASMVHTTSGLEDQCHSRTVGHSDWTRGLYDSHRGKEPGFLVVSDTFVVVSFSFRRSVAAVLVSADHAVGTAAVAISIASTCTVAAVVAVAANLRRFMLRRSCAPLAARSHRGPHRRPSPGTCRGHRERFDKRRLLFKASGIVMAFRALWFQGFIVGFSV